MKKRPYTIAVVDGTEIPDWERKPPKWTDLVDQALNLEPGKALKLVFEDKKIAERARNAIRDTANLRERAVAVRTRLVHNENGTSIVYVVRLKTEPSN